MMRMLAARWRMTQGGPAPALPVFGVLLSLVLACGPSGPRAIALGKDQCSHCHMTVIQERFTAQAVMATGKTFVFDDLGCLANWLAATAEAPASVWVWSTVAGEGWVPASEAVYVESDSLHTPMGSHLAAARPGPAVDSLRALVAGRLLRWDRVRAAEHTPAPAPAS
jgi:copper chaperone NosL